MTYAAQTPTRATASSAIRVGSKASKDVILAQASYDASQILLRAAQRPPRSRLPYIREALRYYGPGSGALFDKERKTLRARGWAPNQATYDAMRLVASNAYAREGVQAIRTALAVSDTAEHMQGLGMSDRGRSIGCGITGGVTAIGGTVASIYGGQAGGGAVGAGGSMVSGVLDCNKDAREAQERIAAAQAAAAQAQANAALAQAQMQAQSEAVQAAERTKQVKLVAAVGGGLLLLLATGYAIVKV